MGDKFKKSHNRSRSCSKLTEENLEQLAKSLVQRGLASRGILERTFSKPLYNRGPRLENQSTIERFRNDYTY